MTVIYVTITFIVLLQLLSIGFGMRIARERPQALWWVVPHMVVVLSLLGALLGFNPAIALRRSGWITAFQTDALAMTTSVIALVGTICHALERASILDRIQKEKTLILPTKRLST